MMMRVQSWSTKLVTPAIAALGLSMLAPRHAAAVLQLSYTVTDLTTSASSSATIVDGGPGDTSAPGGSAFPDGILVLANNTAILPNVIVNGSTSQSLGTPLLPGPTVLSSGSSSVTNLSPDPVHIMVAVGATDFFAGRFLASVTGSGTFQLTPGSTINLGWYDDPTNQQGASSPTDAPGNEIASFSFMSMTDLNSFSVDADPFSVNDPNPFSMTLTFDFTLQPGGSLVSRGQSEIKTVAEPTTVGLIGCAIAAMSALRRRGKFRASVGA
jgi:hypothetical protein